MAEERRSAGTVQEERCDVERVLGWCTVSVVSGVECCSGAAKELMRYHSIMSSFSHCAIEM